MSAQKRVPYGSGREAILSATVQVVAEMGLRGLTFRSVGERAGVNNTLVAHYFGNREALIEAALDWALDRSMAVTQINAFATSLSGYIDQLLESLDEDADLQVFQYEMILEARRRPALSGPIRRLYDMLETALDNSFRQAGVGALEPSRRRALFSSIDGLVLRRVSGNITTDEFRESLESVFDLARSSAK